MEVIIGVLDYTLESVSIATRMAEFCGEAHIKNFWLILNKIPSAEVESMLTKKLGELKGKVIGSLPFEHDLIMLGLSGNALGECRALEHVERIAERLEQAMSLRPQASRSQAW